MGEVVQIVGGGTPDSSNADYWDGDIDWYTPSEIGERRSVETSARKITPEGLVHSSARLLPAGSILFTSRASIGLMAFISRPSATNQGFQSLVPSNNVDSNFLYALGPYISRYAKKHAAGSTFIEISGSSLAKAPLRIPSLAEQRRIGEFFSALDGLIAAAERQEDLLKQKKQAYLQLMFPQEGETEPRLRFAGFSGEWQQKMVGDLVGKTFGGGTPSTSNSEYWIGRLPWIQSSNLADGQIFRVDVEKHISDIALQHSSAQLIPAGSIAVVTHVGVGKLALVPFEYSTSQDFISLGDLKCDSRFLSLALQERLRKDLRVVQGSTIKGITKQDLLHKKLTLPKQRDEQARIATFLMLFGKTIAQINERKALLQRMKEAYLQRLFLLIDSLHLRARRLYWGLQGAKIC